MERLKIKEATRYKIEWCCELAPDEAGIFDPLAIIEAVDAMHNAQATYLKWVHGPKYRGAGEMFAERDGNSLRITMRWSGTPNQAHRLARRDPAFHAIGEEPTPTIFGGIVVSVRGKMDLVVDKPRANLQSVGPIPASEPSTGRIARFTPGVCADTPPQEPPANAGPTFTATVTDVVESEDGPGIVVEVERGPASDPEPGLEMQPPPVEVVPSDEVPDEVHTVLQHEPRPNVAITSEPWPKDVMSVRKIATARGINTSDIKGKGSRKRIIKRLEKAGGSENQTETPEAP